MAERKTVKGHCNSVTSYECLAPAGFRIGSGYASQPARSGLLICGYCGEPVCEKCSTEVDGKPVCLHHSEEDLVMWMGLDRGRV